VQSQFPAQGAPTKFTITNEINGDDDGEIDFQSSDDMDNFDVEQNIIPDAAILDAADRLISHLSDWDWTTANLTQGVGDSDVEYDNDEEGDQIDQIVDFL
jgi:hypothetical protein